MTVIMDVHEKGGIKDTVRQHAEDVREDSGFGCDYIAGDFCIERKNWHELPERMMNNENDLYHQLYKTMNTADELGKRPALLLEGSAVGSSHTSIPLENVMLYLHGAYKLDMQVMMSTGQEMTARLLDKLDEGGSGSVDTGSLRDPAKVLPEDRPQYILEGFDGVGPSTADSLLDHFGTAREVLSATEEELQEVPGIGPATAESIVEPLDMEAGE